MSLILSYLRESRSLRLQYLSCRSVQLLWHFSQTAVHLICFGRSLHPSHEAGLPPSPRLAGCPLRMHRGQPALGRHRPVSILVETSGCCCKGSRDSSASESVCLRRGGHPAERAESGVWVGTPGPVDLSSPRWAPPPTAVGRVSSLRGFAHCASCRGKIPQGFPPWPRNYPRAVLST